MSLRYGRLHQHQGKDSHPRGHRRPPPVLPEQQVSPQTNALQNDRITRERKEKKKQQKKTKMCISRRSPACCIIVIFWYTETDAKRKGTGRGRIHPMIGMIVAVSQLFHPTCQSPTASVLRRIRRLNTDSSTRLIFYISPLILFRGGGADEAHQYPKHLRH